MVSRKVISYQWSVISGVLLAITMAVLARDPVPGRAVMETGTNWIGGIKFWVNGAYIGTNGLSIIPDNTGSNVYVVVGSFTNLLGGGITGVTGGLLTYGGGYVGLTTAAVQAVARDGWNPGTNTLAEVLTAGADAGGNSITNLGTITGLNRNISPYYGEFSGLSGAPGYLLLNGGEAGRGVDGGNAGLVDVRGGGGNQETGAGGTGGAFIARGGDSFENGLGGNAGTVNVSGGYDNGQNGGSLVTTNGGGTLDTHRGVVELGLAGGRTTLQKSSTSNIAVNLPGNSGTLALTADLAGYLPLNSAKYVDAGVTNNVTTNTVIVGGDANALTGLVAGANISITGTGRTRTIAAPNVLTTSGGTITGNLTINGTRTENTTIYQKTTIDLGTNYVSETIYTTNISATTYLVTTNAVITNTVNTYVNNGGSFTVGNGGELIATGATVRLPHLTCTPGGSAVATGTWDFSGATVGGLGTSSITTQNVQGIISAYGAVTNSASNVGGLTLTTSGGIVTLGGSIPPSGDALTTNQVNGLITSGITGKAETNITTTAPSGAGSLVYSNSQFYFTPPSAAGIGSVTNVYITFNAGAGITVNGGASVVATNNSTLTIAATIQTQTNGVNAVNSGTLNFIATGGLTRTITNNGGKADLILDASGLARTNETASLSNRVAALESSPVTVFTRVTVSSPTNMIVIPVTGTVWTVTGSFSNALAGVPSIYLGINGDTNLASYTSATKSLVQSETSSDNLSGPFVGNASQNFFVSFFVAAHLGHRWNYTANNMRKLSSTTHQIQLTDGYTAAFPDAVSNIVLWTTGGAAISSGAVVTVRQEGIVP